MARVIGPALLMSGLVVAVGAGCGAAASEAIDAGSLILQASDFPAGAHRYVNYSAGTGGLATDYSATYNFRVGGKGEEEVTSDVGVATSSGEAKSIFAQTVASDTGRPGETTVSLPAFGDQQIGLFINAERSGRAVRVAAFVIARKNRVVWTVTVENCGRHASAACYFVRVEPPTMTKVQAIAELAKYAAKQEARVGKG